MIVEVTTNLDPRLQAFFAPAIVAEILLVLFEGGRFDENAVVLELLGPFVVKLNEQEDEAAHDRGEHVPPVGAIPAHL